MWISLPNGGPGAGFDAIELKQYMVKNNLSCIIKGACKCTLNQHNKPRSLDYWLRKHKNTTYKDTMQAVDEVIDQLVYSGLFSRTQCTCPTSNRLYKGLALT